MPTSLPLITVFGGTGFLGGVVVRHLLDVGLQVRTAARRPGKALQSTHEVIEADVRNEASVAAAVRGARRVVNAVGLYVEKGDTTFDDVHDKGAFRVAQQAKLAGVERLVHISGIGADPASPSRYVRARGIGERRVRESSVHATVLRPSVLFGPGDTFVNTLDAITRLVPFVPLFGSGTTRLQPVYVDDVAKAVVRCLDDVTTRGRTYELGGPRTYAYKELIEILLEYADRRRPMLPLPFSAWDLLAALASALPSPPITRDQVFLMRQDNVVAPKALTLFDLGVSPTVLETCIDVCLASAKRGSK